LELTAIAVGRKASFALLSPNDCLPTALRLHLNNPQGAKPLDPYNYSATFAEQKKQAAQGIFEGSLLAVNEQKRARRKRDKARGGFLKGVYQP
jgi:hypothetical protein